MKHVVFDFGAAHLMDPYDTYLCMLQMIKTCTTLLRNNKYVHIVGQRYEGAGILARVLGEQLCNDYRVITCSPGIQWETLQIELNTKRYTRCLILQEVDTLSPAVMNCLQTYISSGEGRALIIAEGKPTPQFENCGFTVIWEGIKLDRRFATIVKTAALSSDAVTNFLRKPYCEQLDILTHTKLTERWIKVLKKELEFNNFNIQEDIMVEKTLATNGCFDLNKCLKDRVKGITQNKKTGETIVAWADGTLTKAQCRPDDTFNSEVGALMAMLKHYLPGKDIVNAIEHIAPIKSREERKAEAKKRKAVGKKKNSKKGGTK